MQSTRDAIPVVTSFVFCDNKIALIKRSNQVGTYQGQWGGISGYIERLPIEQALVELEEEAGLSEDALTLRGIGIPLAIHDKVIDRNWLIFPFLFQIEDMMAIKLNWESLELRWVTPNEIAAMDTVPGLYKAFCRIWPDFGTADFWNGLGSIARDRKEGATSLAQKGLEILGNYVVENEKDLDYPLLLRAIRAYAACRPSMGPFPDLACRLLMAIERESGINDIDMLIDTLISSIKETTALSVDYAATKLSGKRTILTLSYGEAIKKTLVKWFQPGCEVLVAESSPGYEGIALAEYLSEHGVDTKTVKDKHIPNAIVQSEAILVGCDNITPGDEIQNKVGTQKAVKAARELEIPAYAVTQTFKIAPSDWPVFIECDTLPGEEKPEPIFDLTPIDWFTEVFTEFGKLTKDRLDEIRNELASVELIPAE